MKDRRQFERSKWEFGVASVKRDGMLYGMGYTREEISRPFIAVVNSWNEYNPGHVHLREVAQRVKEGIREAGGLPFEVTTTGICDGMVLKDPRYIELPSRNLVADEVELNIESNMFDGMVLLSTCDSVVPGQLMAAARCDIPAIMVTGGYMPNACFRGRELNLCEVSSTVGKVIEGSYPREDFDEMVARGHYGCGACGTMTTASSMCCVAEAMGMTLPGNATIDACDKRLGAMGYEAGKAVMRMVKEGITARDIITEEAIKNAIIADIAIAGSTNLLLHLPAIAHEAGLDRDWWAYFDEMSHKVPWLVGIAPSTAYSFKEWDRAGGMRGVLRNLLPLLNGACMTVNGKTIRENNEDAPVYDDDVIRPLDRPLTDDGGIAVLKGNVAPEGAIVKSAAVHPKQFHFEGVAKVYHEVDDATADLLAGKIVPGDAVVIRYLGPKGRFGTTAFTFQKTIAGMEKLKNDVAIITDGRFSGGTSGLSIGYIAPEAAIGGPLAAVENGDRIIIDIPERTINIDVPQDVIEARLRKISWEPSLEDVKPMLRTFVNNVTSTAKGATWK